jgi:hypothetical protein
LKEKARQYRIQKKGQKQEPSVITEELKKARERYKQYYQKNKEQERIRSKTYYERTKTCKPRVPIYSEYHIRRRELYKQKHPPKPKTQIKKELKTKVKNTDHKKEVNYSFLPWTEEEQENAYQRNIANDCFKNVNIICPQGNAYKWVIF